MKESSDLNKMRRKYGTYRLKFQHLKLCKNVLKSKRNLNAILCINIKEVVEENGFSILRI